MDDVVKQLEQVRYMRVMQRVNTKEILFANAKCACLSFRQMQLLLNVIK